MELFHVSPKYNDPSIRSRGILTEFSRSPHLRIYLVERELIDWAIGHVRARHRVDMVTVWVARVHKRSCRQYFGSRWHTGRDILPAKIVGQLAVTADGTVLI